MPELKALLEAVEQNNQLMETVEADISDLKVEIGNLPNKYLPRGEAQEKADRIRTIFTAWVVALITMVLIAFGLIFYVKGESVSACKDNRAALRDVINIAVMDRQPLPTTTPETAAAIERQNVEIIRPLRERLLSLDGTQPEKC